MAASLQPLLHILTVLFLCLLHLTLQTFFKLSSQAARRLLYICFQNPPLPSKVPILQHCTTVVQGCRYLMRIWPAFSVRPCLSFRDHSPRCVMKGGSARSGGIENLATIQSKGSSSFPSLHTVFVQVRDFSGSPQNAHIIGSCHESRLKASLHFKIVEGDEWGRGEGTFAPDLVLKGELAAYACALPCNLVAPQIRTPRSLLYQTIYTAHSKRTSSSVHPFQSAQLLLNQHRQKARQHCNKLAPLTICWSCCSIVCLFKTHALAHTNLPSLLSAAITQTPDLLSHRVRSKGAGLKPCGASHRTGTPPGFGFFTASKTKECPHCSSLEDQGVKIFILALD